MSTFTSAFSSNRHRAAGITKRALQAPHSLRKHMHGHVVVDQIQAAGQRRLSRYCLPLAAVLGSILITSIASVIGILPDVGGGLLGSICDTSMGATMPGATSVAILGSSSSLPVKLQQVRLQPVTIQAELLNALGVTCLSHGDTAGATDCFHRAVETNPQLIAARNNLGTAMLQTGDTSAARAAFQATLQLQPQNLYAQQQLSKLGR
jgi:tetratricopeptide (TPR) repeat protein